MKWYERAWVGWAVSLAVVVVSFFGNLTSTRAVDRYRLKQAELQTESNDQRITALEVRTTAMTADLKWIRRALVDSGIQPRPER